MKDEVSKKLDSFFTKYKHQTYRKGEILVRGDDEPSGIFYLTKGQVKMYLISEKGDEVVLNIFKPISFFPMSWAINSTKNVYFFEAMNEVSLCKAPKEDVIAFVKNNPDILFDLLSRVYRGIDGVFTKMAYLMSGNAHIRLITELLIMAKRFGVKDVNGAIEIAISEKDIGTQTGLTRETVSRELRVLKEQGLVDLKRNMLTIKDVTALQEEIRHF